MTNETITHECGKPTIAGANFCCWCGAFLMKFQERSKRVRIQWPLLAAILTTGAKVRYDVIQGIPDGATIEECRLHGERGQREIVLEVAHPSFPLADGPPWKEFPIIVVDAMPSEPSTCSEAMT